MKIVTVELEDFEHENFVEAVDLLKARRSTFAHDALMAKVEAVLNKSKK